MSHLQQILNDIQIYIHEGQYKKCFKILNKIFAETKTYFNDDTEIKLWVKCCRRMAYVCQKITEKLNPHL